MQSYYFSTFFFFALINHEFYQQSNTSKDSNYVHKRHCRVDIENSKNCNTLAGHAALEKSLCLNHFRWGQTYCPYCRQVAVLMSACLKVSLHVWGLAIAILPGAWTHANQLLAFPGFLGHFRQVRRRFCLVPDVGRTKCSGLPCDQTFNMGSPCGSVTWVKVYRYPNRYLLLLFFGAILLKCILFVGVSLAWTTVGTFFSEALSGSLFSLESLRLQFFNQNVWSEKEYPMVKLPLSTSHKFWSGSNNQAPLSPFQME